MSCSKTPALSISSRTVSSSSEKNCSYFRHFNPGESSEIFEFTTQKGEWEATSVTGCGARSHLAEMC